MQGSENRGAEVASEAIGGTLAPMVSTQVYDRGRESWIVELDRWIAM